MLHRVHLVWARFEHTTSVVIGTDYTRNCRSNYHDSSDRLTKYQYHWWLMICLYCRNFSPDIFSLNDICWIMSRRRVLHFKQKLHTIPENSNSLSILSGVRVTRSLVVCVCFVDRSLSFVLFSFGHCVVCPSSMYGFWLHIRYLPTRLDITIPTEVLWNGVHRTMIDLIILIEVLLSDIHITNIVIRLT